MGTLPIETPLIFTQGQYDEYARLSGDDNPIHVDAGFAARTRFGRTVAHGMFIFGVMSAHVAQLLEGPVVVRRQSLMFEGPTFAGEPLTLHMHRSSDGALIEQLVDESGRVTSSGEAAVGTRLPAQASRDAVASPDVFKGLEVGMSATRSRRFDRRDVEDFIALVDDPNPLFRGEGAEVPPALVAGTVSWLLGVDLPGAGTNWLKQEYVFHRPIPAASDVHTTVTITRLRPEKELVNLSTVCKTGDTVVVTGEALVLARDVAPR
jgi:acyl dehydratase